MYDAFGHSVVKPESSDSALTSPSKQPPILCIHYVLNISRISPFLSILTVTLEAYINNFVFYSK